MSHFSQGPTDWGKPTAKGRYVTEHDVAPFDIVPGLQFRPIAGEDSLLNVVHFSPHTLAPLHAHAEEQVVLVIDGEFEFNIDGVLRVMKAGDVAVVPSWVPHAAQTYDTECTEVDFFTPPRSTIVEYARKQLALMRGE